MRTRDHVVAKRREQPAGPWGAAQVVVRLACLVCGDGGVVGCDAEGPALEWAGQAQWHLGCKLGLVCPCGAPAVGHGDQAAVCFQWPRCGAEEK